MPRGKKKALHPELYDVAEKVPVEELPAVPLVKPGISSSLAKPSLIPEFVSFSLIPSTLYAGLFHVHKFSFVNGNLIGECLTDADSKGVCLAVLMRHAQIEFQYPVGSGIHVVT